MTEKQFVELMEKLAEEFGKLAFKAGWTPEESFNYVKESGVLNILPDSMEFEVCSSMDGRLLVSSKLKSYHSEYDCKYNKEIKKYSIGDLEYFKTECKEFMMWLKATPETAAAASSLKLMNVNTAQRTHQYLMQYMKDITAYADRVDIFNVNNGSEKLYAVHSEGWIKQPCILSVDVRSAMPEEQNCKMSVPYLQLVDDISALTLRLFSLELPIEDSYHRIRSLASEANAYFHDVRSYFDETDHIMCDGNPFLDFACNYRFEYSGVACAIERDIAALVIWPQEDDINKILKSGPYSGYATSKYN